ncbi:hypothetical protein ACIP3U_13035 [[Kitasatospora] papulosa]|uniref:hypothetical protein n=1 Tax=[Kitasatospora] papulosa TaxID=1464011 RepID=UPI00382A48DC
MAAAKTADVRAAYLGGRSIAAQVRGQGYTLRTTPSPPYTEGSSPATSRSMAARGLPAPAVPLELRRRAVRMVAEVRDDYPNETTLCRR